MPHAALRIIGGVNSQETEAQNQYGGLSKSNLIRYYYDAGGLGLVAKLGGWTRFYPTPLTAIIRAMWAWEDLNIETHLAIATETIPNSAPQQSQLAVITDGNLVDITPTSTTDNIAPVVSTQAGNYSVLVEDNVNTGITNYDSVYIATQISIGGLVLFGLYNAAPDTIVTPTAFTIFARDQLGALQPATSTSSSPVLPSFTTIGPLGSIPGSTTVTVTLPNYTYQVGETFPVLTPTEVGGITFYGNYVVQSIIDANNFTILATNPATSSDTGTLNGGLAQFIYSFGIGAIPSGTGYGIGTYGSGGYGTGTAIVPASGSPIDAVDWTLDNWGEILIACPIQPPTHGTPFQPIYQWDPGQPSATIIAAAPPVSDGILVAMPQRQIIAWGTTVTGIQDPLLIRWCDVNNFNVWIGTVTNQAGQYRIPKGSKIVGAIQGAQQALILTDIDAWSMQYVGQPFIYSFNEIGTGCGLIGRKAIACINGAYYWMGPSQFFWLSGNGLQRLPCSVWDLVYQNLDVANVQKIRVAVNSRFNEVQWFYPSLQGGGEIDSYVKYNIDLNEWDAGKMARTAWVDQSVLGPPIGADPGALLLYQHETSNDADGQAMDSYIETGYFSISEGDNMSFIDLVWPDMKWGFYDQPQTATVQITFLVADYPGDEPTLFGPYSVTQATQYFNTRLRGRLVAVRISSTDLGSFWRIGQLRYRFSPDGKF